MFGRSTRRGRAASLTGALAAGIMIQRRLRQTVCISVYCAL